MQVIQETLLAFGVDIGKMKVIRQICSDMGIKAVKVESEEEAAPLGLLAGARNWMNPLLAQNQREMKPLTEEMLVFAGFSDEMLETFLKRLRQNHLGAQSHFELPSFNKSKNKLILLIFIRPTILRNIVKVGDWEALGLKSSGEINNAVKTLLLRCNTDNA